MSTSSQLVLLQTTTSIAQTPPPSSSAPLNPRTTMEKQQTAVNQRLDLYNSLFGSGNQTYKTCQETGLPLIQSLNYSLQTFLFTGDDYWVLSIIDINNFANVKKKYGQQLSKRKIVQIGTVIQKFCQNDARKLKGFKCNDLNIMYHDDDECDEKTHHGAFALLIYSHPQLKKCEKYISKLMRKIKQQTNESVNVGIAKMNEWETFEEWKHRAIKNLKMAKNTSETTETSQETHKNGIFFSDVDVNFVNPKAATSDEKKESGKQEAQGGVVKKFGTQEEFDSKMKEIANDENYEWFAALMSIDDFSSFVFSKEDNKKVIKSEMEKLEKEMYHLFDIYGNGSSKNEQKYVGYRLNNNSGKFGLILYDSKDVNKCFIPAHELMETIKEEIASKWEFTVSIGSSRLHEDDLGMSDDWYERVYNNLHSAMKNGGNQVCFGSGGGDRVDLVESKVDDAAVDNESDAIQTKSFETIKKYGFAATVDLKNVSIKSNDGNLVNESDIVKIDCDPTKTFTTMDFHTDITYKQIFYETAHFVSVNSAIKPYLEYPKMYLNSNNPKCDEQTHCLQCCNNSNSNGNIFSLCQRKRRQIANQLFDMSQQRQCHTDSLSTTARQLCTSDKLLQNDSNGYIVKTNWFIHLYSFLQWQREAVQVLMQNLVGFNKHLTDTEHKFVAVKHNSVSDSDSMVHDEEKEIERVTTPVSVMNIANQVEMNEFLYKFDVLTLLHSYLNKLIEYLVLYYCCFDSKLWIPIFYPFIQAGIGTLQCNMIFAELIAQSRKTHVKSICEEALELKLDNNIKQTIAKEMKALSIFQMLLCDVYDYERDDDDDNTVEHSSMIMCNPFELAVKIGIKLNQTIDNIKTQIVIQEMTGNNIYAGENANNTDTIVVEQKKDDWMIGNPDGKSDSTNTFTVQAPSFIRLFVFNRILKKYVDSKGGKNKQQECILLGRLTNVLTATSCPIIKNTAFDILSKLIGVGLNQYMKKWYNEKQHANIIEMIFNQIILNKFEQEYSDLSKVNCAGDNQQLVFNSADLMCLIFRYLKYGMFFNGDLVSCSLVNSYWLYHACNINSIDSADVTELVEKTWNYKGEKESKMLRLWQRLVNIKCMRLDLDLMFRGVKYNHELLIEKLVSLRNLELVNITMPDKKREILVLKAIMSRCASRIKHCSIRVISTEENQLSPLQLPQAQYVEINDLYFYRIWTNACKRLTVHLLNSKHNDLRAITKKWINFVNNSCDCSNIHQLTLSYNYDLNNTLTDESIVKKFASKFSSLKKLNLFFDKPWCSNILLWQAMQTIIHRNSGKIEAHCSSKFMDKDLTTLSQMITDNNLQCDKVKKFGSRTDQTIKGFAFGGLFNRMYEAHHVGDDATVAIDLRYQDNIKKILSFTNHENIIKLLSFHTFQEYGVRMHMFVFEYMKNGNLNQYLQHRKCFDLSLSARFFNQIINALDYLHNKVHIVHRNLCSSNLLLDDNFNIKISGFDDSEIVNITSDEAESQTRTKVINHRKPAYRIPELFFKLDDKVSPKSRKERFSCDIFNLGIILWEMLIGVNQRPFEIFESDQISFYIVYKLIFDKKYDIWWEKFRNKMLLKYYYNDNLKSLFSRMFDASPTTRITINGIKKHNWYVNMQAQNDNDYVSSQLSSIPPLSHFLC